MSNLSTWQGRVTEYTKQIADINSEITVINNETPTDPDIIYMLGTRKAALQDKITSLNRMLTVFQNKYNEELAASSFVFTSDQQTIINGIGPQYKTQVDLLKKMPSDKQTAFFTLYGKAMSCTQKDCVVRCFFNV